MKVLPPMTSGCGRVRVSSHTWRCPRTFCSVTESLPVLRAGDTASRRAWPPNWPVQSSRREAVPLPPPPPGLLWGPALGVPGGFCSRKVSVTPGYSSRGAKPPPPPAGSSQHAPGSPASPAGVGPGGLLTAPCAPAGCVG